MTQLFIAAPTLPLKDMVKNPGLLPGLDSMTNGDIPQKRRTIAAILDSCWDACHRPDPGPPSSSNAGSSKVDHFGSSNGDANGSGVGRPFVAQLIISNPVTFAHVHCAQKLRVPLHIMFTMPWTPTRVGCNGETLGWLSNLTSLDHARSLLRPSRTR